LSSTKSATDELSYSETAIKTDVRQMKYRTATKEDRDKNPYLSSDSVVGEVSE